MSAEYSVVYYGLKFPVQPEAVTDLEKEAHPIQLAARQNGLDCDWGDCWIEEADYAVFIGKELGRTGAEYQWNQEINGTEFQGIMKQTDAFLKVAGFVEEPKLLFRFVPDI